MQTMNYYSKRHTRKVVSFSLNMTTFTKANLPDSIDTVEGVAAWAITLLTQVYLEQTAIEGSGVAERVAQASVYFIPNNNSNRLLTRLSLQVENNYLASGAKIWDAVMPLGSTAIPSEFLMNAV